MQVDALAEEVIVVAYDPDLDPAEKRVICENLRWLLSKLAPTRYGDRLLVAGDPSSPIEVLHKQANLSDLSSDALDALEHFLLHVVDSRVAGVNGMLLEHDPAAASTQREVVERPAALVEVQRQ